MLQSNPLDAFWYHNITENIVCLSHALPYDLNISNRRLTLSQMQRARILELSTCRRPIHFHSLLPEGPSPLRSAQPRAV